MIGIRRGGIGFRFGLLIVAAVLSTASGTVGLNVYREYQRGREDALRNAAMAAQMLARRAEYAVYTSDPGALRSLIGEVRAFPAAAYLRILDADGRELLVQPFEPDVPVPAFSGLDALPIVDSMAKYREVEAEPGDWPHFDVVVPVSEGGSPANPPIGWVQLGVEQSAYRESALLFVRSAVTSALVFVALGLVLTLGFVRRITSPLRQLELAAQGVASGDLEHAVEARGDDEVGGLSRAFGVMLARLRAYRDEVTESHANLERKVEERTAELRRAREEALDLARRADASSRAKTQFLASMSHEIRTPMNGVLGTAQLLLRDLSEPKQRRLAETILRSGDSLLALINDVLDFSKIEAGRLELESVEFDPATVAEEVCELLAEAAGSKGIELVCHVEPNVPSRLVGDPVRIRQILLNLAGNAVKFTNDGEVEIRLSTVPPGSDPVILTLAVRDTGIGIPEDARERIFDAFAQGEESTTRRFGGSGLGLAIVKRLAEKMGGDVRVESVPGKGSTFTFTAVVGLGEASDENDRSVPGLEDVRALVIEPSAAARASIRELLEARGARVLAVARPEDVPANTRFSVAFVAGPATSLPADRVVRLAPPGAKFENSAAHAWLVKPVRRDDLWSAATEDVRGADVPAGTDDGASRIRGQAPKVLIVEDNEVNRELAVAVLEALGYQTRTAASGMQFLEVMEREPFDAVLLDWHMPELDGTEAVRIYREREREAGRRRVPIIALTASVMPGDRDSCLSSGMDDYVSKPYRLDEIRETLGRWVVAAVPSEASFAAPPLNADPGVLDDSAIAELRRIDRPGSPSVFERVVVRFLEDAPLRLQGMRAAISSNAMSDLHREAHTLKSSSAQLGAHRVAALCRELELRSKSGAPDASMLRLVSAIADELARAKRALEARIGVSA